MNENKWNYNIPIESLKKDYHGTQLDWNQTLLTAFNRIYAPNRFKFIRNDNMVIVLASIKLKPLLESLEYYDTNTMCIANRFQIHYFEPNKPFEMSYPFEKDNQEYKIKLNSIYFILEDKKPINLEVINYNG